MKKTWLLALTVLIAGQAKASTMELIESVKHSNLPVMMELLENGEDVNGANEQGNTALHYAVAMDNADMTQVLLSYGADVNASNLKGWTPLGIAERKQTKNVVPILAKAVAKANETDTEVAEVKEQVEKIADKVVDDAETLAQTNQQYKELLKESQKAIIGAREALVEAQDKVKSLNKEVDEVKAENAALKKKLAALQGNKPAETKSTKLKQTPKNAAKPVQKETPKPAVKKEAPKPAVKKEAPKPSVWEAKIFAGDEEIVYCMNLLGQGENENMLKGAGYFAASAKINEARYHQIVDLANAFYANADEQSLKARNDTCAKIVTPKDATKQNQIVRSLNSAVGY